MNDLISSLKIGTLQRLAMVSNTGKFDLPDKSREEGRKDCLI